MLAWEDKPLDGTLPPFFLLTLWALQPNQTVLYQNLQPWRQVGASVRPSDDACCSERTGPLSFPPPPNLVSAVKREGWRPPCLICLPRYLTQGDGASGLYGGGPVGRAPMRLRLMMGKRGWAFRPSSLRIRARRGWAAHHTPARVSEGPPHPRPGPRETGQEVREHIGLSSLHTPSLSPGDETATGVCGLGVWDFFSFFPFFSWLVVLGPGSRVCVLVWIFCIACMQVRPPGEGARERRLPADSESSEFPRIDPASFSFPVPAQPSPPSPGRLGMCRDVAVTEFLCGVYVGLGCVYMSFDM